MTRYHWFRASWQPPMLARLRRAMLKDEYGPERNAGFRLDSASREKITGQYIERFEVTRVVEDPAGGTLSFSIVDFQLVSFRIGVAFPQLELIDPPRSTRSFIGRVSELTGFEVAIAAAEVCVFDWLEAIEKRVHRVLVSRLQCSGVTLSPRVCAAIAVQGTEDVRHHLTRLLGGKAAQVERVRIECSHLDWTARCELRRAGVAEVDGGGEDVLLPMLRVTLNEALT